MKSKQQPTRGLKLSLTATEALDDLCRRTRQSKNWLTSWALTTALAAYNRQQARVDGAVDQLQQLGAIQVDLELTESRVQKLREKHGTLRTTAKTTRTRTAKRAGTTGKMDSAASSGTSATAATAPSTAVSA